MTKQAVVLMGPTATGKTDLAIELTKLYPIEIISVDSALIYQDMDIGTAKPSIEQLNQVKHHLINIITPIDSYSVADFIKDSVRLINEIIARGVLPVLVGGTMMYFNGLLNGISILPDSDLHIRKQLEIEIRQYGLNKLYAELQKIDPIIAKRVNQNDRQRIIRALEVYKITGYPLSLLQQNSYTNLAQDIDFRLFSIECSDREILHKRINQRFLNMLAMGFIDEVIDLRNKYPDLTNEYTSMRSVGYYQVWQYLDGKISFAELIEQGSAATRQLAKRQSTWLRKMNAQNLNIHDDLCFTTLKNNLIAAIEQFC